MSMSFDMDIIADGLGRQLPHLTVETVLSNSIRKVHTKTPFFRLFTVGKRGVNVYRT